MAKRKSKTKNQLLRTKLERVLRKYVLLRDKETCQWCGIRGVQLDLSHVLSRRLDGRLKFDPLNVKLLCKPCHWKWHKEQPFAGQWFREKFPDRWEYIDSRRIENLDKSTISTGWYDDQIEYVLGLIVEIVSEGLNQESRR